MNFISPEDFGVRYDDDFCGVRNEPARERTDINLGLEFWRLSVETVLGPDLLEPLFFAVVIAKDMNGISLP